MSDSPSLSDAEFRRICHLISHDFRNPLAAILTNLEFAQRMVHESEVDPDLAESVRDSVAACEVLRRIIANFDLLAKGMQLRPTMHDTGLGDLAREVGQRCQNHAEQASLSLRIDAPGRIPIVTDRTLVALALENLIANSVQHAPAGSEVAVTVGTTAEHATISVADAGPAIPEELREVALGVEAHTSDGRVAGTRYGRGLSLLVARFAVETLGGAIEIGGGDQGSSMTLRIPRLDAPLTSE